MNLSERRSAPGLGAVPVPSGRFWRLYETLALLLCAGLICWELFLPPALGVADNNDFPKLIGRYCLGPASPTSYPLFEYVAFSYRYDARYCWNSGLISSAVWPLAVARFIAWLVLPPSRFDLRLMGTVYAVLFLTAFYLVQRLARSLSLRARLLLPAAFLLVFGGAAYAPYFNSFYFDTAAYVFLLFASIALCQVALLPEVRLWRYLLALCACLLFATAKTQHAPLALLMIPVFWMSFGRTIFPSRIWRLVATFALAFATAEMFAVPSYYRSIALYNALFYQCLPHSVDPAGDLASLGLDPAMARYSGQHAFLPSSPMNNPREVDRFSRQFSTANLAHYYLSHPRMTAQVFKYVLAEGSLQRARMKVGPREYRLGNYPRDAARPPEAQSHFLDFWSQWKAALFGNRPAAYLAYIAMLFAALWTLVLRRATPLRLPLAVLASILSAMVALSAAAVLFDAVDTGRHLFLFNTLLDMTACALIAFCWP